MHNEEREFDDGLTHKLYGRSEFRNLLKEEWIIKAKNLYKDWLNHFSNIVNSLKQ